MITMQFDTTEFNQALTEVARLSPQADAKIIRQTCRFVLPKLVGATPLYSGDGDNDDLTVLLKRANSRSRTADPMKAKGRARLGWWAAWKRLGVRGSPKIGNGPLKDRGEGGIIDRSRQLVNPSITLINEVPYIEALEQSKRILKWAFEKQLVFMRRFVEREYSKMLRGKSA